MKPSPQGLAFGFMWGFSLFFYLFLVCLLESSPHKNLEEYLLKNIYFQLCFYLLFYQIDAVGQVKIYPKLNMGYINLMDSLTFYLKKLEMLRSTISLTGWNIFPGLSMDSGVNRSWWHLSFICFLCFCPFWGMLKWRDKALWKFKKKKSLPKVFFENYITVYSNFAFCNLLTDYNF